MTDVFDRIHRLERRKRRLRYTAIAVFVAVSLFALSAVDASQGWTWL